MTPTTFRHAGLSVSDLDRALKFWVEALGMEVVTRQTIEGGYIEAITLEPQAQVKQAHLRFPGGDSVIELLEYVGAEGTAIRALPRDPGGAHVAFTTDDLGAALARLVAAGGEPFSAPVEVDRGVNAGAKAVYVRDPDGHIVELVQPPRGEG